MRFTDAYISLFYTLRSPDTAAIYFRNLSIRKIEFPINRLMPPVSSRLQTVRRMLALFGDGRRFFIAGLALATVDAACQSVIPLFFRHVFNALEEDSAAFMDSGFEGTLLAGSGLIVLFFGAAYFFHYWTSVGMAHFIRNLQTDLYGHIQSLSQDFFQRRKVGEITARLNGDLEVIQGASGAISTLFWVLPLVVFSFVSMFLIHVPLALLFLIMSLALMAVMRHFLPRIRRLNRDVREATGHINATVTEYISVNPLIKSMSVEASAFAEVYEKSEALRSRKKSLYARQFRITDSLQTIIRFVAPMFLLLLGARMIVDGAISSGDLVAFWGYWLIMGNALNTILSASTQLFTVMGAADRIVEFFDERPSVKDPPEPVLLDRARGELKMEQVMFRYPGPKNEAPVLQDISLHLQSGERLALVGPSGGGKSTIFQLWLRFYDPSAGLLRLDGVPLPELSQSNLRAQIGMVMQESVFLSTSVRANLQLARPGVDEKTIWNALEAASAADFVADLPEGLNTLLGERGARLSGGQRQRLSIAWVFLKNPPVILLDEATSALDSQTENLIQKALERLMRDRTSITIAHRLSTVVDAARIVVLNRGRIVDQGEHHTLLQTCPLYHKLCQAQGLSRD